MIRISPMFSDHMVLQRNKHISIFGTGTGGERVTVTLGEDTASARVIGGRWCAVLPAREAAKELELTVRADGFSRTFTDVAVGEVWLAGGQSNMEYELRNCTTGKEHLENDACVNVRFYYVQKIVDKEPAYEEKITNNGWQLFGSETAKCWSAVGYIFAKRLSEKLGCTVGVIGCNWGGTKAAHWMSIESLERDIDMRLALNKMIAAMAGIVDKEWESVFDVAMFLVRANLNSLVPHVTDHFATTSGNLRSGDRVTDAYQILVCCYITGSRVLLR